MNTSGLPGYAPVTDCDFLAYSCAAARDFHPLPSSSGGRGCANQRNCERTELDVVREIYLVAAGKSICGWRFASRTFDRKVRKERSNTLRRKHLREGGMSSYARLARWDTRPPRLWWGWCLESMEVGQKVLDLRLGHDLTKPWHHIATCKNHIADALVVGGHSALRQILSFENALEAAAFLVARGIGFMAAVAMLIVEPAPGGLLWSQSKLGVALAALHVAGAGEENQDAECHGRPRAIAAD